MSAMVTTTFPPVAFARHFKSSLLQHLTSKRTLRQSTSPETINALGGQNNLGKKIFEFFSMVISIFPFFNVFPLRPDP
jgi:hypothetical protein